MIKKLLIFCCLLCLNTWLGAQLPPPCPSNGTPPSDLCDETCIYCNFNGINSTTAGYTSQTPPGFCGSIENEQWLGFIAGEGSATFTATPSNCTNGDGIQIALYETCSSTPIACFGGCSGCGSNPAQITAGLQVGLNYFLMIDGFAGDQCQFNILVDPPSAVAAPPVGLPGNIQGPGQVCPGAEVVYTIPPINGAAAYTWNAPAGSLINGEPPPVTITADNGGTQVTVTFGSAGGQICVRGANSCYTGQQKCKNIIVQPIPPTNLPPVVICFEDAPYETPWGESVMVSGLYQTTIKTAINCDSVVRQQVTVKSPIIKQLPPQTICAGENIVVCGTEIEQFGPFSVTCQSYQGCDSTVTGTLLVFDPMAEILNSGTISCTNTSVTLTSAPSQGIKIWKNDQGQTIGSGPSVTVNQPGEYVLVVTAVSGTVTCTDSDTVQVLANNIPPNSSAVGGTIGCANSSVQINGGSTTGGVTFGWTGPAGFSSNIEDPIANTPGNYVLTVTNPANGCTSTATATVDGDLTAPQVNTNGGTLTCAVTSILIGVQANVPTATFAWSGPNNFSSNLPNPSVSVSGNYIVTVTNPINGCTATGTAIVSLNNTPPNATAQGGDISCATPTVTLNGGSNTPGATFNWAGPGGFNSSLEDPTAGAAGNYTLTVTGTNGCTTVTNADITGNTTPPGAVATGGLLNCSIQNVVLSSSSQTANVSYSWSGPGGFASNQQNPPVNTVGDYIVTITGPNQCTSVATAPVTGDFAAPNADASGGTISCTATSVTINGTSTTPGATFSWAGPGNTSFNVQNPTVNATGTYILTVSGPNGCTTTASADVVPDAGVPQASAQGGTIDCNTTTITINGGSTTPGTTFSWSGPGGFTSSNASASVTTPGNYILTVMNPGNGCSAQATAAVDVDKDPPVVTVFGGTITCGSPTFEIISSTLAQGVTYSWAGPGTFASTLPNPTVNVPGNYILTATGTNGCTATFTAPVAADQNIPITQADGGTLTCTETSVALAGGANLTVTYDWIGPAGFTSTAQNPVVNAPGTYTLTTTAPNGCTGTDEAIVLEDVVPPGATATNRIIDCNNQTVTISGNSTTAGVSYAWQGPGGFASISQNPSVTEPGDYTVYITGPNGCSSTAVATVSEDREPPAIVLAPAGLLDCSQTTVTLDATVTTGISPLQGLAWTGPGGFSNTTEDPDVTVSGQYTLTATSENGCKSSENVTVNQDVTPPNVSALGGTLTCVTTKIQLSGVSSTPGATFLWSGPGGFTSPLPDPEISVAGPYTLRVTGPNGCTATKTVNVNLDGQFPDGVASASNLILTCKNPVTTLTGTSITPGVSFAWSGPNGFTAATPVVTSIADSGYYVLAVTAPNGCVTKKGIAVSEDKIPPDVVAQGDTIDCISGVTTIRATSTSPGATYAWGSIGFSSNLQNPQVSVDGIYVVTVTAANGCTSTAQAEVFKNTSAPAVTLFGGGILTCFDTMITVYGVIQTPGANGIWTGPNGFTSNNDSIVIIKPGKYIYTVTALNGCISAPDMTIIQDIAIPTITLTGGKIDCNKPDFMLDPQVTITAPAFLWSGPNSQVYYVQSPTVSEGGVYNVTLTNVGNGCRNTASATIIEDKAVPDASVDAGQITCKTPLALLDGSVNGPGTYYWEWEGPSGPVAEEEDVEVDESGDYIVTVTGQNGCTTVIEVEVFENTSVPGATAQGVTLTCTSPTGTISASSPTPNVSYAWSGPNLTSNLQNPSVSIPGPYTVTVTDNANGCTSVANCEVKPDASLPQVQATGGTITCKVTSVDLTATSSNPQVTWAWSGPGGFSSTLQNPTITAPGNYSVTATATNGCKGTTAVTVAANTAGPAVSTNVPEKLDCTTTQVTLGASASPAGGPYTYQWTTATGSFSGNTNIPNPTATEAGIYTVVVTNTDNGCTGSEDAEVEVDPATPSGTVDQVRSVTCHGDTDGSISISSVVGGTPPFMYSLDNQPFTSKPNFTFLPPGKHLLRIEDSNGCKYEKEYDIHEPEELLVNLGPDTTIHLGQSIELSLEDFVNFPDRVEQVLISPSSFDSLLNNGGTTITPLYSLNYKVTVVDTNGCKANDTRLVIVDKTRLVYIPNVIDPESDDNNIVTVFGGEGTVEIKVLKIFDRWGEAVHEYFNFAPNDLNAGWSGKYRGKDDHSAVFVYYAEVLFLDGEIKVYKGDVTVLHSK